MKTRLEEHYLTAVRPALIEKFGYGNIFEVPRLEKVVTIWVLAMQCAIPKKLNMQ